MEKSSFLTWSDSHCPLGTSSLKSDCLEERVPRGDSGKQTEIAEQVGNRKQTTSC